MVRFARWDEAKRDREKPHLNPATVAETLYYRGLLAMAFDQGKAGVQQFVLCRPIWPRCCPFTELALI